MFKHILKPALAAGIALSALAAPAITAPAAAQEATHVGVVNLGAVIANSAAYQTAQTQRQTTYAPQIQQAEARRAQLQAQIEPLVTAFNAARQAENPDQAALQTQATQIQQLQQQGQAELQQMLAPVALSQAYVEEQIEDQLQTAVTNAAAAAGVQLVLSPDSVLFADNSLNLNEGVLAQLNSLIPVAQLVPPPGWLPRELREQQEAAQAAQAAQAQQAAAQPAVEGR